MPFLQVKNRASSTLAAPISATDTSLTVAAGEGAKFPDANFHITIDDEILLCTSRTGDTFTVVRAQEETTAAPHSAGAKVELRITARIIQELQNAVDNKVGLTGDETIAGVKTFTSIPVLPATDPTTDNQAVRKTYVDSKFQYEVLLGADVKKGSLLFNGDGIEKVSLNLLPGSTASQYFGNLSSRLYVRQKFLSDDIKPFNTIKVSLRRANYPTDNVVLRVYDETLTTLLAEKTIPGMSLSTSLTVITFDLPLIIPKQTIWIYLTRSGPIDSSNWYVIGKYSGLYAPTDLEYGDGTTWTTEGYDMKISFSFLPTINRAYPSGAIYPELFENYLGLANSDGSKEQTIKVSRFTHFLNPDWNLEPNRIYYLSDTPGEITSTPPENKKVIGYSINSNKLMIF